MSRRDGVKRSRVRGSRLYPWQKSAIPKASRQGIPKHSASGDKLLALASAFVGPQIQNAARMSPFRAAGVIVGPRTNIIALGALCRRALVRGGERFQAS